MSQDTENSKPTTVEQNETEAFKFTELEVQRLNLQPNDVLMATIKHEDVGQEDLQFMHKRLETLFPNNKIMTFAMGLEGAVRFTVASQPDVQYNNYCSDCNCGKKEAAEQTPQLGDQNAKS